MSKTEEFENLDWISLGIVHDEETGKQKLLRKIKDNPFVPIGALLTTACLGFGMYSFRKGEKRMSQMMMRARVLAQGFTVVALAGGILYTSANPKKS